VTQSLTNQPTGPELHPAPKVSVIIPAYNAAAFIGDALDSVFAQTFTNFEVILINDGSLDTDKFEQAIQLHLHRIVYLKQENRGPSAARNLGIRRARGEYVAFLDSDDAWFPEYLAAQMKLLEETPSLDLVYSDTLVYWDSISTGRPYMQIYPSKGPVTFESLLMEDCAIPSSAAVARRRVLQEAGLFDENLSHAEDFDLWLRIAYRGGRMAYQRKVLARHRVRPDSLAATSFHMRAGLVYVLTKLDKMLHLPAQTHSLLHNQLARARAHSELEEGVRYLFGGNLERATDSLSKANAILHSTKLRLLLLGLRIAPRLAVFAARIWKWSPFASGPRRA
jgi:glycosyltransferase involved in cell wall biosynthesis